VECYECGQNKITLPGSNACQCRAGQSPGRDGVCTNSPADAPRPGGCSGTQYEGDPSMRVEHEHCANTTRISFTVDKRPGLYNGRPAWSREGRYMYSVIENADRRWVISSELGAELDSGKIHMFTSHNAGGSVAGVNVPITRMLWARQCGGMWVWTPVLFYNSPNCHECGQNRVTLPGSNACQCRAGQSPGRDGVCTHGPADAVKPGGSAACPSPRSSWTRLLVLGPLAMALIRV